jgi:hypothetical protein
VELLQAAVLGWAWQARVAERRADERAQLRRPGRQPGAPGAHLAVVASLMRWSGTPPVVAASAAPTWCWRRHAFLGERAGSALLRAAAAQQLCATHPHEPPRASWRPAPAAPPEPSFPWSAPSALPLDPGDDGHRGMPKGSQGQGVEPTKSAIYQDCRPMAGSGAGLVGRALAAGGRACQHRPARSLHPERGGRTRLPPRGPLSDRLKSPESVSAQSVLAVTRSNLLTSGAERRIYRCVVPSGRDRV